MAEHAVSQLKIQHPHYYFGNRLDHRAQLQTAAVDSVSLLLALAMAVFDTPF